MMYLEMELHLIQRHSKADPDAGYKASTNNFLERFQHHHRLAAVVHLSIDRTGRFLNNLLQSYIIIMVII